MTVVVGAICRNCATLPKWLRDALVKNVSRHPGDRVEIFEGNRWLLAKIDVGAFGVNGACGTPHGPAFVMAGEPLILHGFAAQQNRATESRALHDDLCFNKSDMLRAATGTFCGAHYSPSEHRLTLVTDKLGLRPIYYFVSAEFAVFASALRVFEAIGIGISKVDLRGIYENCAFGFPLGDRTAFREIRTIGPAEIVHITQESETHSRYFEWDRLEDTSNSDDGFVQSLVGTFEIGVRRRLRTDKAALSFLSGGLDSRAIVAALRRSGTDVFTCNFAPADTQDRIFGVLAAEALGTIHHQVDVPISASSSVYRKEYMRWWVDTNRSGLSRIERPSCIWSGDGGSVGLGHVYLDPNTVAILDRGDLEGGIRSYLGYNHIAGVSNRVMTREFQSRTLDWHIEGVREQMLGLNRKPDGRALHLFLMLNDQRRHLFKHFEDIDIDRFEFHLPFFDSDFLETIIRAPLGPFLRHGLYGKWLKALSPMAVSVPWQAYPNHEPCPIVFEGALRYQWGKYYGNAEDRRLSRGQGKIAFRRLLTNPFPRHLISRPRFAIASLASLLGSSSYDHLVRVGDAFTRYWQLSQQRAPGGARR